MKTKTLLELLTLSSSIYVIAKEAHLMERFNELSKRTKEHADYNRYEADLDEDGNELELVDKIILKTTQLKEELELKIEELVTQFYKKVKISHLDEVKALQEQLHKSETSIALLEARLNRLETKM